jgi:hypothetical protein
LTLGTPGSSVIAQGSLTVNSQQSRSGCSPSPPCSPQRWQVRANDIQCRPWKS